jgi:O-antigen/teichoic acid export membrane protein
MDNHNIRQEEAKVSSGQQAKAIGWSLVGDFSSQGIGFIVSIVLARLLTPELFGLVGMSMVFISLLYLLVDGGFSTALVQQKISDDLVYDSVFWINLSISLLLMLVVWFLGPSIGRFYENPEITSLVRWLSVLLPIKALSMVPEAVLRRNLRFKVLGVRLLFAGVAGGVVGIVMALLGYGVYALVGQSLTGGIVGVLTLHYRSDWKPHFRCSLASIREVSLVGRYIFFGRVLGQMIRQGSILMIGKLFLPATLGFFTRAESLGKLVIRYTSGTINKVYLPVLSKLQDEEDRFRKLFLKIIGLTTWGSFMLSGLLVIGAELLIVTLFGKQWIPSVLIFQVLMLRIFNYPVSAIIINAYLAKGLAKRNFRLGLGRITIGLIPPLLGFTLGFDAFLWGLVAVSNVGVVYNIFFSARDLGVPFLRLFSTIYRWNILFIITVVPCLLLYQYLANPGSEDVVAMWTGGIVAGFLFLFLYLGGSLLIDRSIKELLKVAAGWVRQRWTGI